MRCPGDFPSIRISLPCPIVPCQNIQSQFYGIFPNFPQITKMAIFCFIYLFILFKILKMEFLVKNGKFGQKLKKFHQQSKFSPKMNFWSKIHVFVKNPSFVQKSKFWSKIKILIANRNLGQKLFFLSKIQILFRAKIYSHNFTVFSQIFHRLP